MWIWILCICLLFDQSTDLYYPAILLDFQCLSTIVTKYCHNAQEARGRCDDLDASSVSSVVEIARTSKLFNLLLRVSPFLDGQCLASIIVLLIRSGRLSSVAVCVYMYVYACAYVSVCASMYASMLVCCICVCLYCRMPILYLCMHVCVTTYLYTVCMYVRMYLSTYVG